METLLTVHRHILTVKPLLKDIPNNAKNKTSWFQSVHKVSLYKVNTDMHAWTSVTSHIHSLTNISIYKSTSMPITHTLKNS